MPSRSVNSRPTALGAACACALVAACAPPDRIGFQEDAGDPLTATCSVADPPMPFVQLGPDVTIRTLCGQDAVSVVASVQELGNGITSWSASIKSANPDAFILVNGSGTPIQTCQARAPAILSVAFQADVLAIDYGARGPAMPSTRS